MSQDLAVPDADLVQSLVEAQFPQYGDLPVSRVESAGTDNVLFRLGVDHVVRLPRDEVTARYLRNEQRWLPMLSPHLPLDVPVVVGVGEPSASFPLPWLICRWLPGIDAYSEPPSERSDTAIELGRFMAALQRVDPTGAPASFRGTPLQFQEQDVLAGIADLGADGLIDTTAANGAWRSIVDIPQWDEPPVWVHSDLLPSNIVVNNGLVSSVIDFGRAGVGDPACDLMIAWTLLNADDRPLLREHAEVDAATWARGRGWAFGFGVMAWHYHRISNPVLAAIGQRSALESLAEL